MNHFFENYLKMFRVEDKINCQMFKTKKTF